MSCSLDRIIAAAILGCAEFWMSNPYCADLVIGQVAPLSGGLAATGNDIRAGIELCFDAVNAQGGIHGNKLRLVARDDGYRVKETLQQTQDMLSSDNPIALIGYVGSGGIEALLARKLLAENRIALIGPVTGGVRAHNPYLFHVRASYGHEIEKIMRHLATLGLKRVVVFYQEDDFGNDGLESARKSAAETGLQIVARSSYEKNTTNVANAVSVLAEARPDAVLMVSSTEPSAEFVRKFRESGAGAMLFALSDNDHEQILQRIGKVLARGLSLTQIMPSPYNPTIALTIEFQTALAQAKAPKPRANFAVLEGYASARVLVAALQAAGLRPTRESLVAALNGMEKLNLGGIYIRFSPQQHDGSNFVNIAMINRDGRLID